MKVPAFDDVDPDVLQELLYDAEVRVAPNENPRSDSLHNMKNNYGDKKTYKEPVKNNFPAHKMPFVGSFNKNKKQNSDVPNGWFRMLFYGQCSRGDKCTYSHDRTLQMIVAALFSFRRVDHCNFDDLLILAYDGIHRSKVLFWLVLVPSRNEYFNTCS
jgi:hypothetical protein